MAPSRPALFPDQYALALVTAIVLIVSIVVVLWAFFG
jgi:FlaG/FlaF family flagellin (archaellin)